MRGEDKRTGELFSYVDLEKRVRSDHPLRAIRGLVNEALVAAWCHRPIRQGHHGRQPEDRPRP